MPKKLFLLDGMALVYRAHFALIRRPIFTSGGVNTSALYGFTNTLLDILTNHQPTHIGVAFDTEAPTQRHEDFVHYKAQREEMPEDLSEALPHVRRMIEAFNIPVLILDGYEADDIIGTLVRRAEKEGFDECYMVTPDKDFGQLVTDKIWMWKPGRMGDAAELLKRDDILQRWGIERTEQVIDILGLMGDASDNIPGIPGIGEKTAAKLIATYGSVDNLLEHVAELKGKQRENVEKHREQALLSRRLATIDCQVPIEVSWESLKVEPPNEEALKALFVEFEFNTMGRRLFGEEFKAGRGFAKSGQGELFGGIDESETKPASPAVATGPSQKTIADVPHDYRTAGSAGERLELIGALSQSKVICFDTETTDLDPRAARLMGLSFCLKPGEACYVPMPDDPSALAAVLGDFRDLFANSDITKVGHNLKFDLNVLLNQGITVRGTLFDTMIVHSLVEPDQRHGMNYLAEVYLGYSPIPISRLIGEKKSEQISMAEVPLDRLSEYAAEDADVTLRLWEKLEPLLKDKGQAKVFYEIEAPLLPVLASMECEGVRVDAEVLSEFSQLLSKRMEEFEKNIYRLAGREFNLNSPKQLGEILFDELKLAAVPKKTRTGQFATDEQTLIGLAGQHEMVRLILDYRTATKLKSTYADTLPQAISAKTGRVHTTFHQAMTATGRLASQNPNLQNIPIRTDLGQEIRKAFVPRDDKHVLLSADYSQIELRIIAALSGDEGMLEAFAKNWDVHSATAAKVHGVSLEGVTSEMRRQAKMVNFGIIYGISAFGLAQRLAIPRAEAAGLIEQYFKQYPRIQKYMTDTIESARRLGYVETVTGRRRYLRDINSANATTRNAAERTAINTPIQGSAADMIKLAMIGIHRELETRDLRTRMILQVHDELVFDLPCEEEKEVRGLVEDKMKHAIELNVPIVVDIGTGANWLEAH